MCIHASLKRSEQAKEENSHAAFIEIVVPCFHLKMHSLTIKTFGGFRYGFSKPFQDEKKRENSKWINYEIKRALVYPKKIVWTINLDAAIK